MAPGSPSSLLVVLSSLLLAGGAARGPDLVAQCQDHFTMLSEDYRSASGYVRAYDHGERPYGPETSVKARIKLARRDGERIPYNHVFTAGLHGEICATDGGGEPWKKIPSGPDDESNLVYLDLDLAPHTSQVYSARTYAPFHIDPKVDPAKSFVVKDMKGQRIACCDIKAMHNSPAEQGR